jgi:hypothetical protein
MRLGDLAVLVDDVGDALRVLVFGRFRGAVCDADLPIGVAEKWEGEVELFGESPVGVDVIETGAEDGRVLRSILRAKVPEPGTLGRSAGCVSLRIKPEHNLAASQIVKRNVAPLVIGHFKIGSFIANIQHSSSSQ